jgi:hypothetical protein
MFTFTRLFSFAISIHHLIGDDAALRVLASGAFFFYGLVVVVVAAVGLCNAVGIYVVCAYLD